MLNSQVTTQAGWIAYLDAFQLMMILTLCSSFRLLAFCAQGEGRPAGAAQVPVE